VSARRDAGGWRVCVADNGAGIEPAQAERVFGMFQRATSGESHPGTGMGLAISKRIVERHGGRIWAEATPGGGATLVFTLPDRPPDGRERGGRFGSRARPEVSARIR